MAPIVVDTEKVSKSTVGGYLTAVIAGCVALPMLDTNHVIPGKVLGIVIVAAGFLKIVLGHLTSDPDTAKVNLPDGGTAEVPAHAIPDDPALVDKVAKPQ